MKRLWLLPPVLIAGILGIVVFAGLTARARRAELALERVRSEVTRAKFEAIAADKRYGATLGQLVSERELTKRLTQRELELLRAVKKADPGAHLESLHEATVTIVDQPKGTVVTTPAGEKEWQDEYHRFRLQFPRTDREDYLFWRSQRFGFRGQILRSHDGKMRLAQGQFTEYDPVTELPIPNTNTTDVKLAYSFTFTQLPTPKPPILRLRPLAGIDHRRAFAGGAEFINLERTEKPILERLTGAGMAYWKPNSDLRLALRAGYRLWGNVSLGGYYGWEIPKLTPVVGGDVNVRLGN